MSAVFNGDGWRQINSPEESLRAEQCAELLKRITGARWGTYIHMFDNRRIRYFLLHLTNHDAGRKLMKECIWKACPDGGYYASKSDNPAQRLLIMPEPDLAPLQEWVKQSLSRGPKRWQNLTDELREELWLDKHLNEVVRRMRSNGAIVDEKYEGKFVLKNNPLLRLVEGQQTE